MSVEMRDLWGDRHPLVTAQANTDRQTPLIVEVPAFGHLVAAVEPPSTEPIVALAGNRLRVALVQPGGPDGHRVLRRDGRKVDDGWEVELLPNSSGEDRLVVCIPDSDLVAP